MSVQTTLDYFERQRESALFFLLVVLVLLVTFLHERREREAERHELANEAHRQAAVWMTYDPSIG